MTYKSQTLHSFSVLVFSVLVGGCGQSHTLQPQYPGSRESKQKQEGSASLKADGDPVDPAARSDGMIRMEILRLAKNPSGGVLVFLQETGQEERIVTMVIGEFEARAISLRLMRQKSIRPLTHDFLEAILREYRVKVLKLEVDDLKEQIFLGRLFLMDSKGKVMRFDIRPSDGMVLATGAGAPIYMSSRVVERIGESLSDSAQEESAPRPESNDEEVHDI